MTVKEMHIEVEQSTQKIASNRTRKLFPSEIDWILNKNMERFVQTRVTPKKDKSGGYEITAFDADAIKTLMRTGIEVSAYRADPRRYYASLPGDYSYLISDESIIKQPFFSDAVVKSTNMGNYLLIPVNKSTKTAGPYYSQVSLSINGVTAFDIVSYAAARNTVFSGYSSVDEVYSLGTLILRALSDAKWDVYWERCGDLYFPKTFIISTGQVTATGSIIIDGVTYPGTSYSTSLQAEDLPLRDTNDNSNRLTASNLIQNLREVAFYKTQPEAPLSELSGQSLYVYADKSFIVTNLRLSYVRRHKKISLILGDDCELPESYHQMICDLTEEYYQNELMVPNWEAKLQDNMKRTAIDTK